MHDSYACFAEDETETNFESKKSMSLKEARYEEACNRLAVEAVKRGCTDNVTVMLIDITRQNSKGKTSGGTTVQE